MASPATATAIGKGRAGVTEAAKAEWWLRFNNGAPADDGDAADSGDEAEEEEDGEGAGGRVGTAVSGGMAARAVARDEEAEMGSEDGRAAAAARGVKAGMVARGGGSMETGAAGSGGKRRSSPRFADRADLNEEISGGSYVLPGELPRRKKMAVAKRSKPKVGEVQIQNDISQGSAQRPCPVLKSPEQVYGENENLRLQLDLTTSKLKQTENRRLELELHLKGMEIESLQKQNEELKSENEQLRKNAKPPRVKRLCRYCNTHEFHDYRNCPKRRRQAAGSPEEEDGEDSY
ncbi:unnamed protein product [Urochloa decumbens]|uniref:Uncharacterized protein n=1 Tax=Urochloa decumbens TaxID=240449 RepID=A0ABC8YXV8_9POAL